MAINGLNAIIFLQCSMTTPEIVFLLIIRITRFACSFIFSFARYYVVYFFWYMLNQMFFLKFSKTIIKSLFIDRSFTRFARSWSLYSFARYNVMLYFLMMNPKIFLCNFPWPLCKICIQIKLKYETEIKCLLADWTHLFN